MNARRTITGMRRIVCLVLLAAGGVSFGQEPAGRVTFTARAANAAVVLKQLSAVTHVDFQATPEMESEILVISVQDAKLSDLMARVATATSGEWHHSGSTYRLAANQSMRRQEERGAKAARLKLAESAIRKFAEVLRGYMADRKSDTSDTGEKDSGVKSDKDKKIDALLYTIGQQEGEVLTGLFGLVDAAQLAELKPGDRAVYATSATRTQYPFGPGADSIVDRFIKQHNESLAELPPDALESMKADDEDLSSFQPLGQISKATLPDRLRARRGRVLKRTTTNHTQDLADLGCGCTTLKGR